MGGDEKYNFRLLNGFVKSVHNDSLTSVYGHATSDQISRTVKVNVNSAITERLIFFLCPESGPEMKVQIHAPGRFGVRDGHVVVAVFARDQLVFLYNQSTDVSYAFKERIQRLISPITDRNIEMAIGISATTLFVVWAAICGGLDISWTSAPFGWGMALAGIASVAGVYLIMDPSECKRITRKLEYMSKARDMPA